MVNNDIFCYKVIDTGLYPHCKSCLL